MSISRRRALGLMGSAVVGGIALACGESGETTARPAQTAAPPEAAAGASLTVYSGRSEKLVGPIIEQFGADTGVQVGVKYAGTPQLAATLLEEGSNSPADVFFAQDPGGLGAVEQMLAPLPQNLLSRVPQWARSPQDLWIGVSGRARTVVYNTERLSETDLPDDVWDFTAPEWKGRMGWAPTNASFQTMVTGMRKIWSEERTREWLSGMQANETGVYPKNTPIVAAAGAGEIDAGLVNHYYLHRFLAEEGPGFGARNYHPRAGGPGALVMVAGAGILETASNRDAAEQFVDYLTSRSAQEYFSGETYEYPLLEGVEASSGLTPLEDIDHPGLPVGDLIDMEGTQNVLRDLGILP